MQYFREFEMFLKSPVWVLAYKILKIYFRNLLKTCTVLPYIWEYLFQISHLVFAAFSHASVTSAFLRFSLISFPIWRWMVALVNVWLRHAFSASHSAMTTYWDTASCIQSIWTIAMSTWLTLPAVITTKVSFAKDPVALVTDDLTHTLQLDWSDTELK